MQRRAVCNSAQILPDRHRSTSGFGILAWVAEGFDVFLPVYNAAPPVTRQKIRNFRRAWASNRKLRKLQCSEKRFPKQTYSSKMNSIASRIPPAHARIFDFIQDLSCVQFLQNGANLAPKKAKIGPTIRPDGVQRRQNRVKLVQRQGQNHLVRVELAVCVWL